MKSCIFIDGENFRKSLKELFIGQIHRKVYLPKADWGGLFDTIANNIYSSERLRAYWYVIRHIDFYPNSFKASRKWLYNLLLKDIDIKNDLKTLLINHNYSNPELVTFMDNAVKRYELRKRDLKSSFEGWSIVQDTIETKYEAVEFRRTGSITYNLFQSKFFHEKAVDVNLAVDLLELRNIYDVAIIISGDQDYVPVVKKIKDYGKKVVNVSFLKQNGVKLPGGAWRLNKVTDKVYEMPYNDVLPFMNF